MISFSKNNNFDFIRLLAALQVVLGHCIEHLKVDSGYLFRLYHDFFKFFPGVPIFFFISGFLIYWSYDRNNSNLKQYFRNRILRIYPSLWLCFIFTLLLVLYFYPYHSFEIFTKKEFYFWFFGQITFIQFYTSDFLRFWGVGTPNGSLWTIIVELQFYVCVPLLYYIIKKNKKSIFYIIIFSISINFIMNLFLKETIIIKLLKLTVFPYLYYFCFGILCYIFWEKIQKMLRNKFFIWLIFFISFSLLFNKILGINTYSYWISNPIKLINDILLCLVVFSLAFSFEGASKSLLKKNDVSYGVYIYHMLVVNVFVSLDLIGNPNYIIGVFIVTIVLAYLSWTYIEKPALKLK